MTAPHRVRITGKRGDFLCEIDGVAVKNVRTYSIESGPHTDWVPTIKLEVLAPVGVDIEALGVVVAEKVVFVNTAARGPADREEAV